MRSLCAVLLVIVLSCGAVGSPKSSGDWLGQAGLGIAGGLAGTIVAVSVIAETMPQIESRWGRTALVVSSLTVIDGLGAAGGVLAAARIWDSDGSPGTCVAGGLIGGLASAFVEPLLYSIGVPEGWTEFLGMTLLPILPAVGAMVGFRL